MEKTADVNELYQNFNNANLKYICPDLSVSIFEIERAILEEDFCQQVCELKDPFTEKINGIETCCRSMHMQYELVSLRGRFLGSALSGNAITQILYHITFGKNKRKKQCTMLSISMTSDENQRDKACTSLKKIDEKMKKLGFKPTEKTISEIAEEAMEKALKQSDEQK